MIPLRRWEDCAPSMLMVGVDGVDHKGMVESLRSGSSVLLVWDG